MPLHWWYSTVYCYLRLPLKSSRAMCTGNLYQQQEKGSGIIRLLRCLMSMPNSEYRENVMTQWMVVTWPEKRLVIDNVILWRILVIKSSILATRLKQSRHKIAIKDTWVEANIQYKTCVHFSEDWPKERPFDSVLKYTCMKKQLESLGNALLLSPWNQ